MFYAIEKDNQNGLLYSSLLLKWAPPQEHSDLDPIGCMTGLKLVVSLFGSEPTHNFFPAEMLFETRTEAQNSFASLKVGKYAMKMLLPISNCRNNEQIELKCNICSKVFRTIQTLRRHSRLQHEMTKVI